MAYDIDFTWLPYPNPSQARLKNAVDSIPVDHVKAWNMPCSRCGYPGPNKYVQREVLEYFGHDASQAKEGAVSCQSCEAVALINSISLR